MISFCLESELDGSALTQMLPVGFALKKRAIGFGRLVNELPQSLHLALMGAA